MQRLPERSTALATRWPLLAAAVSTLLFAALTPMAWHTARVGRVDRWVLDVGLPTHTAVFDVGREMSFLGSGAIVAIITVRLGFQLWRRERRPSLALATIGGVTAAGIAEFVAKMAIARPRPSTAALTGQADFGFPSGHTAGATALAVTVIALLYIGPWSTRFSTRRKRLLAIGAGCYAIGVALSRVMVGAHYVTDTVAGLAIGIVSTSLAFVAVARFGPAGPSGIAPTHERRGR